MIDKTIVRRETAESERQALCEISPILARIFAARGVKSPDELERGLGKLIPFHQLKGIEQAVQCLRDALIAQKRFLIVGDFDADGATSSAIAVSGLRMMGVQHVHYLVPNRFEFGYGLTPEIVEVASEWQPDVLITVDNGIASCDGVARAKEKGMQVVVTDHHLPGDEIPDADAIVNPNQHGDEFPSKNLAGCGVIFYVLLALRAELRAQNYFTDNNIPDPKLAELLDLVALGTVADVVPLDHNNRILVHQGLSRMQAGHCRPGIRALLTVANRKINYLQSSDLGFAVAPRLNAAGRLDDMSVGIACLLAEDESTAMKLANQLDELNKERREIESDMQIQALEEVRKLQFDTDNTAMGLVIYEPNWHQGVIGLVAGRIKERMHRPVIAFAKASETEFKGSARSIPGLHIRDALDRVSKSHPDIIKKFGGHAMAAGLSIDASKFTEFKQAFDNVVKSLLTEQDLQAVVHSDGELVDTELNVDMAEEVVRAGPWGQAFPEPIFDGQFTIIEQRLLQGKHLKLMLGIPGTKRLIDAICFNVDVQKWPNHRCNTVQMAYRLDINRYGGRHNLQLMVEQLTAL